MIRLRPIIPASIPHRSRAQAAVAMHDARYLLMRGLAHGILLSMVAWAAVGYLTFRRF